MLQIERESAELIGLFSLALLKRRERESQRRALKREVPLELGSMERKERARQREAEREGGGVLVFELSKYTNWTDKYTCTQSV